MFIHTDKRVTLAHAQSVASSFTAELSERTFVFGHVCYDTVRLRWGGNEGKFDSHSLRCCPKTPHLLPHHLCTVSPFSQYPAALMNLGAILHLNGKLPEAEANYLRALQLKPDDIITQSNLRKLWNIMDRQGLRTKLGTQKGDLWTWESCCAVP